MKILNYVSTKIIIVILIVWLVFWFIPLILSGLMIDILLRFLGVRSDLLMLNRLAKLLGEISIELKTKNTKENNQENIKNE